MCIYANLMASKLGHPIRIHSQNYLFPFKRHNLYWNFSPPAIAVSLEKMAVREIGHLIGVFLPPGITKVKLNTTALNYSRTRSIRQPPSSVKNSVWTRSTAATLSLPIKLPVRPVPRQATANIVPPLSYSSPGAASSFKSLCGVPLILIDRYH